MIRLGQCGLVQLSVLVDAPQDARGWSSRVGDLAWCFSQVWEGAPELLGEPGGWFLSVCRFVCLFKHVLCPAHEDWQGGTWARETYRRGSHLDNGRRVFYCRQIISRARPTANLQALQRHSSPTGTIITKQILALLSARPQRGQRRCQGKCSGELFYLLPRNN